MIPLPNVFLSRSIRPSRASDAFLVPTLLACAASLSACGGGSSSGSEAAETTSPASALAAPADDGLAEIDAVRASLLAFVEEARPSLPALSERASALVGGAPDTGGATRTPGGGGGAGGGTPTTPVLTIPGAPYIDRAKLVQPSLGLGTVRVAPTNEAVPSGDGAFRTSCAVSHMSNDDPIVFPGQPGRSHLHTFFGNTGANASSTADSLRTTGNSTCRGGIANRSAYWVPTMIDTRDGTPVAPAGIGVYYKGGLFDGSAVQPIPAGLRMIAGDAAASGPSSVFAARFKCIGGPRNQNDLYGPTIGNCDKGAEVWQEIFFPQCWDGRNLDSPDHKSHMSYTVWSTGRGYHCPGSHPVVLPQISFNVIYVVPETNAAQRWRLASDTYSTSIPGGYSSHGDWFNGWIGEVSDTWSRRCVQAKKDCHSHLLGDGRMIY